MKMNQLYVEKIANISKKFTNTDDEVLKMMRHLILQGINKFEFKEVSVYDVYDSISKMKKT